MQRILQFNVDDIVVDPDAVLERINQTCGESGESYRLRGVCQLGERVSFILTPRPADTPSESYVFGWLEDTTAQGLQSALMNRWSGGYDTIGSVDLGEDRHMLVLAASQS